MANEESDSSEYETSSDEIETDSEDSSMEEEQSNSSPFELPFIKEKDKFSHKKIFDEYLKDQSHFLEDRKKYLMKKTSEKLTCDFTPWWEQFKRTRKKKLDKDLPSTSKEFENENESYNSWFDKSSSNITNSSWLSGSRPKSGSENATQVEDIDVPSIYGNVSKPKGRRALKKERKEIRNKTTGKKWFDMKVPDVDSKVKMDMELLQMRRALNPKRFYKQNDRKGLPKYFQLGTVVDEGTDFYSSRLTKKQRKQTLVEELMADVNIRQYNKKKYEELQQKQRSKKFPKKAKA